ncbi:1-acyl-sn-glycerol-3-phosphate acyltransferase [Litoribrevibacter euphylliae]|uniref:1-acyl-sn-glycerol-3-phosphate acyltransferase n=1 Tax=Litoribrevibacter euphylliae TaxID=1834034 RepID=A0ABV7HGT9_9GAMM
MQSTAFHAEQSTHPIRSQSNSFQVQELLQHLQIKYHDNTSSDDIPSDVTAFMVFFSHWVKRRFEAIRVSGLEALSKNRHHIFVSNHRDILLDPVLVNHALLTHGYSAARSTIGSNLTEEPSMATLMKLAGCLEVPRGNMPLKQKFVTLKKLSNQIQRSLESNNIWIAQREGRAKNGIDQTNPAVLKMLTMAKNKGQSQAEFLSQQSIIPVAISYQWDPSDTHKALETYLKGLSGSEYSTATRTDTMEHLIDSLDRCQGQVELHFGAPLKPSDDIENVTQQVDEHIHQHYQLFDTHQTAYHLVNKTTVPEHLNTTAQQIKERTQPLPVAARNQLIQSYANSYRHIKNRQA